MKSKRSNSAVSLVLLTTLWCLGLALFVVVWAAPIFAIAWTGLTIILAVGIVSESSRGTETAPQRGDRARRRPTGGPAEQPAWQGSPGDWPYEWTERSRAFGNLQWSTEMPRPPVPPPPRAAIAGVGDIGSRVAVALVQSSVTRLAVADMDVVERDNVGQSAFRAIDIGQPKVFAIQQLCRETNPAVEVRVRDGNLRDVTEPELDAWLGDASMLVLSIDDPVALLRLHDHFYGRVPTVSAGIHDRGESGHVVYTIPGRTGCLRCALGIRKARDLVQIRGNAASPEDVQRIAGEAASVALKLLDPVRRSSLEVDRTVLFMNNRLAGGFRSSEANWLQVERQSNCRVCRGGSRM